MILLILIIFIDSMIGIRRWRLVFRWFDSFRYSIWPYISFVAMIPSIPFDSVHSFRCCCHDSLICCHSIPFVVGIVSLQSFHHVCSFILSGWVHSLVPPTSAPARSPRWFVFIPRSTVPSQTISSSLRGRSCHTAILDAIPHQCVGPHRLLCNFDLHWFLGGCSHVALHFAFAFVHEASNEMTKA